MPPCSQLRPVGRGGAGLGTDPTRCPAQTRAAFVPAQHPQLWDVGALSLHCFPALATPRGQPAKVASRAMREAIQGYQGPELPPVTSSSLGKTAWELGEEERVEVKL